MSATPPPKTERNQLGASAQLLLVGGILFALGLVIALAVDCVPTLAGLVLAGAALVSRRARKGKPFA